MPTQENYEKGCVVIDMSDQTSDIYLHTEKESLVDDEIQYFDFKLTLPTVEVTDWVAVHSSHHRN